MKTIFFTQIIILTFSLLSFGQTNQTGKNEKALKKSELNKQNTIIQLEKDFYQAKLENNVKFIDEILSDDCISTNPYGGVKNKSALLTLWKTFKTRTYTLDSVHVKLVNDTTAIASGWQTENGAQNNFTHHLIKQNGKWQIRSMVQKFPEFQKMQGIGSYRIIGNLKGADEMAISLLGRNRVNMNAAIVKDGKFIMEGKAIEYPDMVTLITPGKRESASFFLENSEITITGNIDSLSKVKVTGSKTQDEYVSYLSVRDAFRGDFERLMKEGQLAEQNKDSVKLDQIKKEAEEWSRKIAEVGKEFIKNNPKSYGVPVIFSGLFNNLTLAENEAIIQSLDPGVAKTQIILGIIERVTALKAVDIGKKAPDFTLNNVDGVPVSLSSKIGSKLLLIDFWAAWCAPCRRENPNLVKTYNEFRERGFEILGVSLDRTQGEWEKGIATDKLPWTQVSDLKYWNSVVAKLYAVTAIPANFLLDQNGIIIARNLRGDDLKNKLKEILGE
jgi:peroxiredoxin